METREDGVVVGHGKLMCVFLHEVEQENDVTFSKLGFSTSIPEYKAGPLALLRHQKLREFKQSTILSRRISLPIEFRCTPSSSMCFDNTILRRLSACPSVSRK